MSLYVDIEKALGSFRLNVQFETQGGVLALLGASGCGKSMALKCIAGIEKPDRGRIVLDGVTLFDSENRIDLSPQKRKVGYLFQQYALFPNMTVRQNIVTGVRNRRDAAAAVPGIIRAMHLEGTENKKPHQLSGGQQQRAALARILVNEPNALLLDEPFSALDSHLRFQMEQEVRDVIRGFRKTVLLVSHDRDEVFRLSDSIAIMREGRIETQGAKKSVFANPATISGAILTGCKNVSPLAQLGARRVEALDWGMELALDRDIGGARYVGIRMHDICSGDGENAFRCRVVEEIENPFSYTVMLRPLGAEGAAPLGWEMGKEKWNDLRADEVTVHFPAGSVLLLNEPGGKDFLV